MSTSLTIQVEINNVKWDKNNYQLTFLFNSHWNENELVMNISHSTFGNNLNLVDKNDKTTCKRRGTNGLLFHIVCKSPVLKNPVQIKIVSENGYNQLSRALALKTQPQILAPSTPEPELKDIDSDSDLDIYTAVRFPGMDENNTINVVGGDSGTQESTQNSTQDSIKDFTQNSVSFIHQVKRKLSGDDGNSCNSGEIRKKKTKLFGKMEKVQKEINEKLMEFVKQIQSEFKNKYTLSISTKCLSPQQIQLKLF